jgi:hypothetical protein
MFDKLAEFFRGLVALGGGAPGVAAADAVPYKGYLIRPAPRRDGAHWNIAGSIVKESDPGGPAHEFIRADSFSALDEAVNFTVIKARQIIDERGGRLLD